MELTVTDKTKATVTSKLYNPFFLKIETLKFFSPNFKFSMQSATEVNVLYEKYN